MARLPRNLVENHEDIGGGQGSELRVKQLTTHFQLPLHRIIQQFTRLARGSIRTDKSIWLETQCNEAQDLLNNRQLQYAFRIHRKLAGQSKQAHHHKNIPKHTWATQWQAHFNATP
eukprot:2986243-Amphidinium_carterae.1